MRAVAVLLMLSVAFTAGAADVIMRIAAEPEALLPGLTPSLRISITNDGASPVEVPRQVALQVTPPRGEPFIAHSALRGEDRTMQLAGKKPLVLAPGASRDLTIWSGDSWFGADERFRTTGVFRLLAVADRNLDSLQLTGLSRILDQPGLAQPLVSNEATFTVVEPAGADLAVWNYMKQQRATCSAAVAELIWGEYPTSRYAAYCVRYPADREVMKQIAALEASLAKGPHPYWADGLRLHIASSWLSRASGLLDDDVDGAVDAYDRARTILEPLAKHAVAPEYRKRAAQHLEFDVKTREQVVELHRAAHGFDDRPLRFYVTCFENLPDGRRKVWFGYNNPNRKQINIPVGADNKFTPPPFDRTQTTTFLRGIIPFAFNIVTKEPVLNWHLQGKTAQFKVPDARECPKGFDPENPSTWEVEE